MIAPPQSDTSSQPLRLQLRRTFHAPRERVFRAWTEPALLRQWWGPRGFTTPTAEIDLRTGGRYRVAMQPPEGETLYLHGTYREVTPPSRLVYTWQWEGDDTESVVTVEFVDQGGATEVVVTHERLPDQESLRNHTDGWGQCLDRLEELLSPSTST
jgi:uncharacterized protein YndB with AHSA1/START domain